MRTGGIVAEKIGRVFLSLMADFRTGFPSGGA